MRIEVDLDEFDRFDIGKIIELVFRAASGYPVKDEQALNIIKHYGKPVLMLDSEKNYSWDYIRYFHMPSVGGSSEVVEKGIALDNFANDIAKEFRYNESISYYHLFRAAAGWEIGGKFFYEEGGLRDILAIAHPDEPECSDRGVHDWRLVESRSEDVGMVNLFECNNCGAALQESDLENLDEGFLRSFANSCAPKFKCYGDRVSDLDWNVYKYIPL